MFRVPFIAVVSTLALVGCAQAPPSMGRVQIAPKLTMVLPSPAEFGATIDVAQLVTARYGDQTVIFEGRAQVAHDRMHLVVMDTLGRTAMTIAWSGAGFTYTAAAWLPKTLHPENMLADIVLLYWPEPALRHALEGSGGTLETRPGSRSIFVGGTEVVHIDYLPSGAGLWSGEQHLKNLAWKYELQIRTAATS